jgi:hypothetical protein
MRDAKDQNLQLLQFGQAIHHCLMLKLNGMHSIFSIGLHNHSAHPCHEASRSQGGIIMHRLLSVAAIMVLTIIAAYAPSGTAAPKDASEYQYEAMNPWAEVDPIPLRGLSPRINSFEGKTIGLFANFKRSAMPIAKVVEAKLKAKFPAIKTDIFHSTLPNVLETETINKEKFAAWAKSVDAVVAMVGD